MTYEHFCDAIKGQLAASGPQTWTEIRTACKLPQKFPNNKWVHQMESDIGLVRENDHRGVMMWRLP